MIIASHYIYACEIIRKILKLTIFDAKSKFKRIKRLKEHRKQYYNMI